MRTAILLTGLALFFPALGRAEESPKVLRISLRTALGLARKRNAQILMANERVRGAVARIGEARSPFLPQIGASASESRQTRNLEASGIQLPRQDPRVGPFNVFDARLKLGQALFDAAARRRLEEARLAKKLSEAELKKTEQDVLALAAHLYLSAKRARFALGIADVLLHRDERHLKIAETRLGSGIGTSLERDQAQEACTASLQARQAAATNEMETRLDLTAALGLSADTVFEFEDGPEAKEVSPSREELAEAVKNHPDVRAAGESIELARASQRTTRAGSYPKLAAAADYGASGNAPADAVATYFVGAQVSMPISEGGDRRSRLREAESRVRESELLRQDTERRVEAQILKAGEICLQAKALVRSKEEQLSLVKKQSDLARTRHQSGIGSDLEEVDAAAREAVARDQRDEASVYYWMGQVNLAHALGRVERILEP